MRIPAGSRSSWPTEHRGGLILALDRTLSSGHRVANCASSKVLSQILRFVQVAESSRLWSVLPITARVEAKLVEDDKCLPLLKVQQGEVATRRCIAQTQWSHPGTTTSQQHHLFSIAIIQSIIREISALGIFASYLGTSRI